MKHWTEILNAKTTHDLPQGRLLQIYVRVGQDWDPAFWPRIELVAKQAHDVMMCFQTTADRHCAFLERGPDISGNDCEEYNRAIEDLERLAHTESYDFFYLIWYGKVGNPDLEQLPIFGS